MVHISVQNNNSADNLETSRSLIYLKMTIYDMYVCMYVYDTQSSLTYLTEIAREAEIVKG